MQVI
ncbi:hypothetical protein ECMA6_5709, partial [Escherichia coli MA6]|jgi:L-amino acid N-acyltransferase YncA